MDIGHKTKIMSSLALVRAIQEQQNKKDNTSDRNLEEGENTSRRGSQSQRDLQRGQDLDGMLKERWNFRYMSEDI